MKLLFVRHGKAEEPDFSRWPDDSLRPLSDKGERRFVKSVKRIRAIAPDTVRVFTSPYTRALRTAEILCSKAGWGEPIIDERLAGSAGVDDLLDLVQELDNSCTYAFVGHDPTISLAPATLIGAQSMLATPLKTGAIALVDTGYRHPEPGNGTLLSLVQPKTLWKG